MAKFAIVIADSREAVVALAIERGIQIDRREIKEFDSLETTYMPSVTRRGKVDIRQRGFAVIGLIRDV